MVGNSREAFEEDDFQKRLNQEYFELQGSNPIISCDKKRQEFLFSGSPLCSFFNEKLLAETPTLVFETTLKEVASKTFST